MALVITSLMTVQAFAEGCGIIATKKSPLNIRQGANQTAKVLEQAAKESAVRILEIQGAWYKVFLNNGKVGYGSMDYIKELTPKSPESCGIIATKKTPLNIRQYASQTSNVLAQANKGSAVRILSFHSKWYQVLLNNGIVGYTNGDYVRVLQQK
jgi:uncharacterized protein YgiM (DUF1202 family)